MKTNDLIASALSQKMKWKKTQTNDVLNAFIEIIRKNLSESNDIELLDIGLLENRIKEQKIIVNPKTHRKILYPPKNVLELLQISCCILYVKQPPLLRALVLSHIS